MKTEIEHPDGTRLIPFEGGWKVEAELIVGKWHKTPKLGKALFYITKITEYRVYAYGFDYTGKWSDEDDFGSISDTTKNGELASKEEVKHALIKESERRKYTIGTKIKRGHFLYNMRNDKIEGTDYILNDTCTMLQLGGSSIFEYGQWAEICENPNTKILERIATIERELKQLKSELR